MNIQEMSESDLRRDYPEVTETVSVIERHLHGRDVEVLAELLARNHRTHQQGFGRLAYTFFMRVKEFGFDLRNKETHELATQIATMKTKDGHDLFFPYV